MDKKAAAEFLEVSEKTVSRYVSAGRLPSRYVRGKTGQQLDFDQADLDRLKAEMVQPVERTIEVRTGLDKVPQEEAGQGGTSQERTVEARRDETTLATVPPSFISTSAQSQIQVLASLVKAVIDTGRVETGQVETISLSDKLLLTLPEASRLSGVSEHQLRKAIKAGELRTKRIGRSHKVLPKELKAWVETQFSA